MQAFVDPIVSRRPSAMESFSGSITGHDSDEPNGGKLISPHPMRRPSVSSGLDSGIPDEILLLGHCGNLVVDGITPNCDNTSSVLQEAALSFKRTGAGAPSRMPRHGPARTNSFNFRSNGGLHKGGGGGEGAGGAGGGGDQLSQFSQLSQLSQNEEQEEGHPGRLNPHPHHKQDMTPLVEMIPVVTNLNAIK